MKVSIGLTIQPGPWGGGNQFVKALQKYLEERGVEVFFDLSRPDLDLIMLTDPRIHLASCAYNHDSIFQYLTRVNPNALVVHRVNECDERKGTTDVNPILIEANRVADHTVFVSSWLRDLLKGQGMPAIRSNVIKNGSDRDIFNPKGYESWNKSGPIRFVTHHWGANHLKGFDIYEKLDAILDDPAMRQKIEFTYIGNLPKEFSFRNAKYVEPLSGHELAAAIQKNHVYLTASQNEPGGNHQNEGANCGLPVLYRESGCMQEYCEGFGVSYNDTNFENKLKEFIDSYPDLTGKMSDFPNTSENACAAYYELFQDLMSKKQDILATREFPDAKITRKLSGASENGISTEDRDWLLSLKERTGAYVDSLKDPRLPGKFFPCKEGATEEGKKISLGFSCFALKIYYALGLWTDMHEGEKNDIIQLIKGNQNLSGRVTGQYMEGAFIDPAVYESLRNQEIQQSGRIRRFLLSKGYRHWNSFLGHGIRAETKQAFASLLQVGERPAGLYAEFPRTPRAFSRYLRKYDWTRPWEAGGRTSGVILFLMAQGNYVLSAQEHADLIWVANDFYKSLARPETGAYYQGDGAPSHGELVNGAMKVLTILEWLGEAPHYPEKLIDTTLTEMPSAEGCHIVDAVYVLHYCLRYTDHRYTDIVNFCSKAVGMIRKHFHESGGFSYYVGKSQMNYYGVTTARGLDEADIHGTSLLIWALAMILDILRVEGVELNIIRP